MHYSESPWTPIHRRPRFEVPPLVFHAIQIAPTNSHRTRHRRQRPYNVISTFGNILNNTLLVTPQTVLGATAQERTCRRDTTNKDTNQLEGSWNGRLLLDVVDRSGECIVGTLAGVMRVRTIRRRPADERSSALLVHALCGTRSRHDNVEVPPVVVHEELVAPASELPHDAPSMSALAPRQVYIRPDIELRRFGCIHTCRECDATTMDSPPRNHTMECRRRIDTGMVEDLATHECRLRVMRMSRDQQTFGNKDQR